MTRHKWGFIGATLMNAGGFQLMLTHGGESEITFGDNGQWCAICGMDGMESLPINHNRFDISESFKPIGAEVKGRLCRDGRSWFIVPQHQKWPFRESLE